MANQAVSITPKAAIETYGDLPDTDNSYLPRGKLSFLSANATIAAKTVTNTMSLSWNLNLPANFAYSLCYLTVLVDSPSEETAGHFINGGKVMVERISGDVNTRSFFALLSDGAQASNANNGQSIMYRPMNQYGDLVFNQTGAQPRFIIDLFDDDTSAGANARALYANASFNIFDIRQVTNVRVNAPVPVRVC